MALRVDVMNTPGSLTMFVVSVVLLGSSAKHVAARPTAEPITPAVSPAQASEPAVQLPHEVKDILKLSRAKIHEDVIIAFVEHPKRGFNLTAADVIELRKQGVSDRVVTAML